MTSDGGFTIITGSGEIDMHTAPRFEEVLLPCVSAGSIAIADLTAVTFIDSTGIGVFVKALEIARPKGLDIGVVPSDPVRKVLHITGLDTMLRIFDTLADAKRDLSD